MFSYKKFLLNLALSLEVRLPECSLKLFLMIRNFVSYHGLFMGHGFVTDTSRLREYMKKNVDAMIAKTSKAPYHMVCDVIRWKLKSRGLRSKGKKAVITARLEEALLREGISPRDVEREFQELISSSNTNTVV